MDRLHGVGLTDAECGLGRCEWKLFAVDRGGDHQSARRVGHSADPAADQLQHAGWRCRHRFGCQPPFRTVLVAAVRRRSGDTAVPRQPTDCRRCYATPTRSAVPMTAPCQGRWRPSGRCPSGPVGGSAVVLPRRVVRPPPAGPRRRSADPAARRAARPVIRRCCPTGSPAPPGSAGRRRAGPPAPAGSLRLDCRVPKAAGAPPRRRRPAAAPHWGQVDPDRIVPAALGLVTVGSRRGDRRAVARTGG